MHIQPFMTGPANFTHIDHTDTRLSRSTPTAPLLRLLLCLLSLGCARSDVSAQNTYIDVQYGPASLHKLDVYASAKQGSPIIILVHGGAWFGGSKTDLSALAEFLRSKGYTVASVNYRVSWQATYPANISDLACSIGFMKQKASYYNGDPDRVALIGHSAGGHLAALQGLVDSQYDSCSFVQDLSVDGVIGGAGIYSFQFQPTYEPNRILQMLGDSARYYVEAQPVYRVHAGTTTKFLLLTAIPDNIVDPRTAYEFRDTLASNHIDVTLQEFYSKNHIDMFENTTSEDSVMKAVTTFLDSLWPEEELNVPDPSEQIEISALGKHVYIATASAIRSIAAYSVAGQLLNLEWSRSEDRRSVLHLPSIAAGPLFIRVTTDRQVHTQLVRLY